ncbi:YccF domain-containing protein [Streptomyces sp. ACA25]|uniref:YccF domain-containing protein n=1 Tax=Streptomyces sp. ACA25 TaxID=3022596 RepID=UPI0023079DC7|nr:YccF domain-containing protein [Streptomyces sp. ACA25]MDB1090350.1 YccF domain-containing protein [Streptomyces sp. ACA25]
MKTVLNVIWLIFSGLWMAIGYAVAGLICLVLIITIPWGLACFRIAAYALWPFGYRVVQRSGSGLPSGIGNIIWLLVAGIWISLAHVVAAVGFFLTIIGIPFGIAHLKMIPVSLMPLGREIVPTDSAYPSYRW